MISIFINIIYLVNLLVMINLVFRERRGIEPTIGWIMVLAIFPIGGFFIYLIFGRRIKKDKKFKLKKEEDDYIKECVNLNYEYISNLTRNQNRSIYDNKELVSMFLGLQKSLLTVNNSVEIYNQSDKFFDKLLKELSSAKDSINVQYYIFKDDDIGKKIIEILEERQKQGVSVRLLYDSMGSRRLNRKSLNKLKSYGGKTAEFFPSILKCINLNLNYRNHRKIVVIDKKVAFMGGFNIGDEYLGRDKRFGKWRDTHLMIKGQAVGFLNLRFFMDWKYACNEDIDYNEAVAKDYNTDGDVAMQIVSSGPDTTMEEIKYGYLKVIQKAKRYVYIQSPYLILDESILESLKIACLSGIDVRIMIPSKPDHPFVYWATYSYAGELIKLGAKVYIYDKDSFLHAKTVVSDDTVCSVGTANMDIRSFALNFEVNAFMYSRDIAIKQREMFEEDILNSICLTIEEYENRGKRIKFKESISRLLSPIL